MVQSFRKILTESITPSGLYSECKENPPVRGFVYRFFDTSLIRSYIDYLNQRLVELVQHL